MIILSISSAAIIYSAWYMNIPVFSLGWFCYCLAWTPLFMILTSAHKYDNESKHDLPKSKENRNLHRAIQK